MNNRTENLTRNLINIARIQSIKFLLITMSEKGKHYVI
jgi:hypothetical protein